MTSRERVLTACNHRQPDRVPVDLSGHPSSGIAAIAYAKLRDYLGLPKKTLRVYDPIQQLAIVDDDVLEKFGDRCPRSRPRFRPRRSILGRLDIAGWYPLQDAGVGIASKGRRKVGLPLQERACDCPYAGGRALFRTNLFPVHG